MSVRFTVVTVASRVEADVFATLNAQGEVFRGTPFQSITIANGIALAAPSLAKLPFMTTLLRSENPVQPGALLNAALERAAGEFVGFLCAGAVPEPYWQVGAAAAFAFPEVAAVAARLTDARGEAVRACGAFVRDGRFEFHYAGFARDAAPVLRPTVLDCAPLCGLIMRREHLAAVGGYDATFPESLFDFDWTLRARMKGLCTAYRPDVTVRYDGPLALGHSGTERSSAEHFLGRWQSVFQPNLRAEIFLP